MVPRCKKGTRRNKKTGNCEPTNKGTLKKSETKKANPLKEAPKLNNAHKMNKTIKMMKVNESNITEILNEIFNSEYEKLLRYEHDILTKSVMSYFVRNYTMLTVYRIEKDVIEKVYTTYKESSSQSYDDLYNAVIEAIDFDNNPITTKCKNSFERAKEILHNISKSKKNKKITKREVEDAVSAAAIRMPKP
jgi:hypothetical protein